jgi:hypothetical protein
MMFIIGWITAGSAIAALGPWSEWTKIGTTGIYYRVSYDDFWSTSESWNIKIDYYNGYSQAAEFDFRISPWESSWSRTPHALAPSGTFRSANGFYPEFYVPKGNNYSVQVQNITFPGGGGAPSGGGTGGDDQATGTVHLEDGGGWKISNGRITIKADKVVNDRNGGTSGTLQLSIWATTRRYSGGTLRGYILGSYKMRPLAGGYYRGPIRAAVPYKSPPYRRYYTVLSLSEYTSSGYVLRDYLPFKKRVRLGRR